MARTTAELPQGTRITDYVSLGVITRTVPLAKVHGALAASGRASIRQRDLPAHVVVYYVIALALYMQSSYREVLRCLLEGIQWLEDPSQAVKVAGRSGISQARTRLGSEPLRQLHDEIVGPIAAKETKGAWYRSWRLVSLDGSTLDVADERANEEAFGRPGASRGASAYPQIRFVSLVENGTHVLFGSQMSGCRAGEVTLARSVLPALQSGMLCLADRQFFGFELYAQARASRRRPALAAEEEPAPALRRAPRRRLLPELHLPVAEGPPPQDARGHGARHRLRSGRGRRRRTAVPPGDQHSRP